MQTRLFQVLLRKLRRGSQTCAMLAIAAFPFVACEKRAEDDGNARGAARGPTRVMAAADARQAPRTPLLAPPVPEEDLGPPAPAAVAPGDWLVAPSYRFRLEELRRCGEAGTRAGAPSTAAAPSRDVGASPLKTNWVGAQIRITSSENELYVSPRDITLERGGIILQAKYINEPTLPSCTPLLRKKQLRAGQSIGGVALFQVAPSFRAASGPIVLAYRPTRWGGAPRVVEEIPACLDECENSPAPKQKGRGAARTRANTPR